MFNYLIFLSLESKVINDCNTCLLYITILLGMISIDTAKEKVYISNLDKKSLDEIETNVNCIMQDNKKRLYEN